MTIYILDKDPKLCAQMLDDKSLDKMIKSIAQVLCNAHYIDVDHRIKDFYKNPSKSGGHLYGEKGAITMENKFEESIPLSESKNCEWSEWAYKCKANYLWLVELGLNCIKEYNLRFSLNMHMLQQARHCKHPIEWARDNVPDLPPVVKYENGNQTRYILNRDHTPLPLVMPKKYFKSYPYSLIHIVESYRNWYQAKMKKLSNCECSECKGMLALHDPQWTNQSRPEWLNLEG